MAVCADEQVHMITKSYLGSVDRNWLIVIHSGYCSLKAGKGKLTYKSDHIYLIRKLKK